MKIGVIGTGMVGNAVATKLVHLGHEVKMGSRTASNEKAAAWVKSVGPHGSQGTFAEAAAHGQIIFNCTAGVHSLNVLKAAGEENLKGKLLIDIANPLDFSRGMPPSLTVCNTDSLGEQIQREFLSVKVVKALNTMNCQIMVDPVTVNNGDHDLFLCGNDADAKTKAKELLKTFGWKEEHLIDLGDITAARGTEQLLPIWVRLMGSLGTPMFQLKVVR